MHQRKARHEIAVQTAGEALEGARDHACGQIAALVNGLPDGVLPDRVFGRPGVRLPVVARGSVLYGRCDGHDGLLTPVVPGE